MIEFSLFREDDMGSGMSTQLRQIVRPSCGKHQVEDHQVGLETLEALVRGHAVALDEDLVVVALEVVADGSGEPLAVLDQQHPQPLGGGGVVIARYAGFGVHVGEDTTHPPGHAA